MSDVDHETMEEQDELAEIMTDCEWIPNDGAE